MVTRDVISRTADELFSKNGFENVTVDDIARAADVGRMTVFNHFARKEDMFFDRDPEGRAMLCEAIAHRWPGITPIESLRLLVHRLADERHPIVQFSTGSQVFLRTVAASATLKARAREIRDEVTQVIAAALAETAHRPADDAEAQLAAALLLATWTVALSQAHAAYGARGDAAEAQLIFLSLVDRGAASVSAAMAGTPYA